MPVYIYIYTSFLLFFHLPFVGDKSSIVDYNHSESLVNQHYIHSVVYSTIILMNQHYIHSVVYILNNNLKLNPKHTIFNTANHRKLNFTT